VDDIVLKLIEGLKALGTVGMLVFIIYGGYKRWWVWGYQLTDLDARYQRELESSHVRESEWREIALSAGRASSIVLDAAKR
jgi:hypothetical protein